MRSFFSPALFFSPAGTSFPHFTLFFCWACLSLPHFNYHVIASSLHLHFIFSLCILLFSRSLHPSVPSIPACHPGKPFQPFAAIAIAPLLWAMLGCPWGKPGMGRSHWNKLASSSGKGRCACNSICLWCSGASLFLPCQCALGNMMGKWRHWGSRARVKGKTNNMN